MGQNTILLPWDNAIKKLFNKPDFNYPKSVNAVFDALFIGTNTSSIVLDFAGSGTTAHAVINLNREDNGKRNISLLKWGVFRYSNKTENSKSNLL